MSDKLSKSTVLYVFNPPSRYTCSECAFIKFGKCTDYVKSDEDVAPHGSCNDWRTREAGRIEGNHDRTREATGYMENPAGFSCKRCEYFVPDTRRCKEVNEKGGPAEGRIDPNGCCNAWDKSPSKGSLSDAAFRELL